MSRQNKAMANTRFDVRIGFFGCLDKRVKALKYYLVSIYAIIFRIIFYCVADKNINALNDRKSPCSFFLSTFFYFLQNGE